MRSSRPKISPRGTLKVLLRTLARRRLGAEIADALRQSAGNAGSPNNLVGWGVAEATAAFENKGLEPFNLIQIGQISRTGFNTTTAF